MSLQGLPITSVPDTTKTDGQEGTGSNVETVDDQKQPVTYVPKPGAADDK